MRSFAGWVLGLSLWAAACSPPEVQLVAAPEWPAPAARGAFVGVFDADGALTVYPHRPGGVNPLPWVPHAEPLRVAAGVVDPTDARVPPGGIIWQPVREGPGGFAVSLDVWRWEAFRRDAWGIPDDLTARFFSSREACPTFWVESLGEETEPSTTASRRLTILTGGAVAVIPEDWRVPSPPTYRIWNAEGLGPTTEGTAPRWSCAARGLRLLIDGTRYAALVDDARPWPDVLSSRKILTGPTGVNPFGPCVALKNGWGASTVDGSGFFVFDENSQVRRATAGLSVASKLTALLVTDDDTPVACLSSGGLCRVVTYGADEPWSQPNRGYTKGIIHVAGDIIAWGPLGIARLVVERNDPPRWEAYSDLLREPWMRESDLLEYRDGLLALTPDGEVVVETAGGTVCLSSGKLPQTLSSASVQGVVVGREARIVVSELVGNAKRFRYYTLVPE